MSAYDYNLSRQLVMEDPPFYAIIMAAMRKADSNNLEHLIRAFPAVWQELQARYAAPGGVLATDAISR